MYLSNSRLISLFLALLVLTLSLLWLLGSKANLPTLTPLTAGEPLQLAAKPLAAPEENNITAIPSLEPAKETISPAAQAATLAANTKTTAKPEPITTAVPTQIPEVATIPDNLVLSEKELKTLSTKERKQYEKMMENLHALREQSTQLTSEHQRLEQHMQELERRNQELTQQLEAIRQNKNAVPADKQAKP